MTTTETEKREAGFELAGRFYRWAISDTGKDLMLVDRFTGMPVDEFFEAIDDDAQRGRAPIILAMIATSVRAGNPDWSVERIVRSIMDVSLSEIVMVEGDSEEEQPGPPPEAGETPAASTSPADESSPSSTPPEKSDSETLYAIPA